MSLVSKTTWCPKCGNGSIIRSEHLQCKGPWPKLVIVRYSCTKMDCRYENNILVKVNKRMRRGILRGETKL